MIPSRLIRPSITAAALALGHCMHAAAQWPRWGGPNYDFKVTDGDALADRWPDSGPRQLWRKSLGDGYSAVCAEALNLSTLHRGPADTEVLVCLRASNGETVWKQSWSARHLPGFQAEFGAGPHATPLLEDGRIFAVGTTAQIHAFDQATGKPLWNIDLVKNYGYQPPEFGYTCSPMAYGELLILPMGGDGTGVVAIRKEDGEVAWAKHDFAAAFASPMLINLDGQDQAVLFGSREVIGIDPISGDLKWRHAHATQYNINASAPVFSNDGKLFISSAYDAGSRMLELRHSADGRTAVKELWFNRRLRIHHGNAIRIGELIFGSSGDFGPAFLMAVDATTGDVKIRERDYSKATLLYADGKLIILEEDGDLTLARPQGDKLEVLGKTKLFSDRSWTVPTLVGTTLYARNQREIVALDLGKTEPRP